MWDPMCALLLHWARSAVYSENQQHLGSARFRVTTRNNSNVGEHLPEDMLEKRLPLELQDRTLAVGSSVGCVSNILTLKSSVTNDMDVSDDKLFLDSLPDSAWQF